jgi:FkbM family methyltransferase
MLRLLVALLVASTAAAAAAVPTHSLPLEVRLEKLAKLKSAGALTDAEFEAAKAKLLGLTATSATAAKQPSTQETGGFAALTAPTAALRGAVSSAMVLQKHVPPGYPRPTWDKEPYNPLCKEDAPEAATMAIPSIVSPVKLAMEPATDCVPFVMDSPLLEVAKPYTMCLYPGTELISRTIRAQGVWEPHVLGAFVKILKMASAEDANILDVGGNIGFFTLVAAAHGWKVFTVEAAKRNAHQIMHSAIKNGFEHQITLFNNAAGDLTNNVVVFESRTDKRKIGNQFDNSKVPRPNVLGEHGMKAETPSFGINMGGFAVHSEDDTGRKIAKKEHSGTNGVDYVEVVTLDDVLAGVSIYAMKIDVEGFEARVFNGFRKVCCNTAPTL